MKTIKKNSLIYRWNKQLSYLGLGSLDATISKTLCSYTLKSIWNLTVVPVIWYLTLSLIGFSTLPLANIFLDVENLTLSEVALYSPLFGVASLLYVFCLISTFIYIAIGLCWVLSKIFNKKENKEVGLIRQYIRDIKEKRCSLIKFED